MQQNTYKIDYAYEDADGITQIRSHRVTASGPIIALNEFHRFAQKTNELDHKRQIVRPKLRHDQYQVTALWVIYSSKALDPKGGPPMISSSFDLPKTSNPDLISKRNAHGQPKAVNSEFPFVEQLSRA
jgi:hypothetical protein